MSTKSQSLNTQLDKLNELTAWFEQDDFDIEQAVQKYEEAAVLAEDIKKKLMHLENTITVLKTKFDTET